MVFVQLVDFRISTILVLHVRKRFSYKFVSLTLYTKSSSESSEKKLEFEYIFFFFVTFTKCFYKELLESLRFLHEGFNETFSIKISKFKKNLYIKLMFSKKPN